ncbi:MAG TPA: LuxR C-terminal-related transcriptional regulator, partial [bacterium]|nr:LuxR C-terminal-related transcriptional regulator [bacterium]
QQESPGEAINHALAASDYNRAADLLERATDSIVKHGRIATFLQWANSLPEEKLSERPRLCVFHAITMLYGGYPLKEVEERVNAIVSAEDAEKISGELAAFRALVTTLQGRGEESVPFAEKALQLLPEDNLFLRSLIAGIRGLAYLYSGNLPTATRALQEAAELSRKAGNIMNAVLALCHLAELSILSGDLSQAKVLYEEALEVSTDRQGHYLPVAGIALAGLGNVSLEWHEMETAEQHLTRGIELTNQWAWIGTLRDYLALAKLKQVQGDLEEADTILQKARQVAIDFDATEMDDRLVDISEIRLRIVQNRLDEAQQWFTAQNRTSEPEKCSQSAGGVTNLWKQYLLQIQQMVRARLFIRRQQPEEAVELLQPVIESIDPEQQAWFLIEMHTITALAYQAAGQIAAALESLGKALALAEPGGFVTLFVSEGEPMAEMLEEAYERKELLSRYKYSRSYVKKLLLAFETVHRVERAQGKLLEPLSDRELEVLHLLATGLTNSEIADKLYISLNTVRTHTKNIYAKLNVHSRTKAAARGKELGLI